jgi:hypothetical protein
MTRSDTFLGNKNAKALPSVPLGFGRREQLRPGLRERHVTSDMVRTGAFAYPHPGLARIHVAAGTTPNRAALSDRPPTPERPGTVPSDPEEPKIPGDQPDQGVVLVMTTIAKLLAQKQRLLERLQEDPGPHEREEIERLLAEIDAALNQLDE